MKKVKNIGKAIISNVNDNLDENIINKRDHKDKINNNVIGQKDSTDLFVKDKSENNNINLKKIENEILIKDNEEKIKIKLNQKIKKKIRKNMMN